MKCPACSAPTMLMIAWVGERHPASHQPNVFTQYKCQQGHYFETLSIFNGMSYEEHYIPFGEPKRDLRASIN